MAVYRFLLSVMRRSTKAWLLVHYIGILSRVGIYKFAVSTRVVFWKGVVVLYFICAVNAMYSPTSVLVISCNASKVMDLHSLDQLPICAYEGSCNLFQLQRSVMVWAY